MRKEVLAIGCALMMLCGCGNNSAAQHYESGWTALEKKDYSTAEQEFQQVIDLDSRLAESYRAEGIAYYSEGPASGNTWNFYFQHDRGEDRRSYKSGDQG